MAVVGQVGSGKSSLLSAMLGEMEVVTGATHVNVKLDAFCGNTDQHYFVVLEHYTLTVFTHVSFREPCLTYHNKYGSRMLV